MSLHSKKENVEFRKKIKESKPFTAETDNGIQQNQDAGNIHTETDSDTNILPDTTVSHVHGHYETGFDNDVATTITYYRRTWITLDYVT